MHDTADGILMGLMKSNHSNVSHVELRSWFGIGEYHSLNETTVQTSKKSEITAHNGLKLKLLLVEQQLETKVTLRRQIIHLDRVNTYYI